MADADNESGGPNASESSTKELDRFLPMANVSRIMKKALPANAKISKDAKETVQECVSEFVCFVTGEASDKCQREKRKTANGDDPLWAMKTLGFEEGEKTAATGGGGGQGDHRDGENEQREEGQLRERRVVRDKSDFGRCSSNTYSVKGTNALIT